ncbi:uncharacterized protein LOC123702531 [Colias croceus]|uniref:uncharacterized protein LOC123702531 n=1 Tax=Colias crocea TaxID=72248 RepID=UPI001E27D182|nr:uncharacterized protein LOC123702531 [Colias croceus]
MGMGSAPSSKALRTLWSTSDAARITACFAGSAGAARGGCGADDDAVGCVRRCSGAEVALGSVRGRSAVVVIVRCAGGMCAGGPAWGAMAASLRGGCERDFFPRPRRLRLAGAAEAGFAAAMRPLVCASPRGTGWIGAGGATGALGRAAGAVRGCCAWVVVVVVVRAMGPAFLLRASRRITGHDAWFAGCGPAQLAQMAGASLGRGQSAVACPSPQRTQASGLWQLWEECLKPWQRWHCAGPRFERHASMVTPGICISSLTS